VHLCPHLPDLAERRALGCTQVCETEGTNCSLSGWKVLCPRWLQMRKNNPRCPVALLETTLLLKRDDYRVRQQAGGDLRTIQMLLL